MQKPEFSRHKKGFVVGYLAGFGLLGIFVDNDWVRIIYGSLIITISMVWILRHAR